MTGLLDPLRRLRAEGVLADLDLHFAGLLARLGEAAPEVLLAGALVSRATGLGHVCLHLAAPLPDLDAAGPAPPPLAAPPADAWAERLGRSPVVGRPGGDPRPLVLDGAGRLYLHRYWAYERELADALRERAARPDEPLDAARAREGLARLFPRPPALPAGEPDGQKVAAALALLRNLCIVSGGPGTGKTTTVVKILALLQEQAGERPLRVALAAPTGKAAARIQEAVRSAAAALPVAPAVRAAIPAEAATLHRLLGVVPGSREFRHGPADPLPHDAVVVDEVSMVDLALMAKLVGALRPATRLVLLGDRDQLASVEAGAVLGDLCDTGAEHGYSPVLAARLADLTGERIEPDPGTGGGAPGSPQDNLAILRWSYRFGAGGGLDAVSGAVNAGRAGEALRLLRAGAGVGESGGRVAWREMPAPERLAAALEAPAMDAFGPYLETQDPGEALARFGRVRILCARRGGPDGADAVNRRVEELLARRGLVEPGREWYPGRPVMVTRNDAALRLYNGDVGLALPDPEAGGALRVFFPAGSGGSDGAALRAVAPLRLPPCETVYAMTVHKSQGSEFDAVLLLLGARPSRVLTRELVYTGLTRARQRAEVWGSDAVLREAVSRRVERSSGLRDALWGPKPGLGDAP